MTRPPSIEGTLSGELLRLISERLSDIEIKTTSHQLEQREYDLSLGQIEALRWCKEEIRALEEKLL